MKQFTTENGHKINLPLMKDCRVDYTKINGKTYSYLVESETNFKLYCVGEGRTIKNLYSEFKFKCIAGIEIDNLYNGVQKLEGVNYYIF